MRQVIEMAGTMGSDYLVCPITDQTASKLADLCKQYRDRIDLGAGYDKDDVDNLAKVVECTDEELADRHSAGMWTADTEEAGLEMVREWLEATCSE